MNLWHSGHQDATQRGHITKVSSNVHFTAQVLWDSVPAYLRRLDGVLTETVGKTLPIHAAPVVFASWMGGDRCVNCSKIV